MEVKTRKVGNSLTATIPMQIVDSLNINQGDVFSVYVKDGLIMMKPKKKRLRGEVFMEEYYNKPFSEITSDDIETEILETGRPIGEEIW